jgi:hypothetical protein
MGGEGRRWHNRHLFLKKPWGEEEGGLLCSFFFADIVGRGRSWGGAAVVRRTLIVRRRWSVD